MTEREKSVLIRSIKIIKKYLNPTRVILFGSRAKRISTKSADFDIAVDTKKNIKLHRKVMDNLVENAGLYKIDLVYLSDVDKNFRDIIFSTGNIIYEKRN